ncbi:MAG: flagellar motor protein MotB [Verrucomicrobia bacterium]|nr:MAG: flagellar motor protein MotB [Verrucomicrobiota bacterium]
MHALSRKALFLVISAATIFATGCRKRPNRPDPSSTVMSQPAGLNPNDVGGFTNGFPDGAAPGTDLSDRGSSDINDPKNQIRGILEPVYFAYDQSAIAAPERAKLDAAKTYLDANPTQRLLIEGRADWRGTGDYNLGLGDRRANAAKQYLVTLGVPDTKVEILSKGDLEAVENASDDVMAKDRRGDLVVLKQ